MLKRAICIQAFLLLAGGVIASGAVIYSNNPSPGDSFTNSSATDQGQAVGSSGWYYNNVRNNATVGINTTYPNAGNGSVYFNSPSGSGKADIAFLAGGVNVSGNYYASGSLGLFSDLGSFSYSWYRDSSSTVASNLHPALRVLLDADGNLATITDRGGLVFELAYNGGGTVPVDTWVTNTVSSSTYLWNYGLGIGFAANINASPYAYDATLAEWQAYFPNAVILGFNAGVGSGWNGVFSGAVDSISWTLDGQTQSFNFEVQPVPEPSSWLLSGAGLIALGLLLRRRAA